MSEPIHMEEFTKLDPLAKGYEFKPGHSYLIVAGKHFSRELASSLFKDLREMHPDLQIAVVQTLHPKEIEVKEKPSGDQSGTAE